LSAIAGHVLPLSGRAAFSSAGTCGLTRRNLSVNTLQYPQWLEREMRKLIIVWVRW
jgi:hypothetical protein